MRILTALSGILLALGGAFCFAYNTHAFSELAFVMGLVMFISGLLCVIAYIASGRSMRLPDTLLVENIVTILFGFAVLNDQVPNDIIAVFFGAWLVIAGANRLTQGITISRFNPKNWFRVLPLGAVCALLGAIMTMPTLVSTMNAMILVGSAFILNGLSQMILSMYVYTKPADKALEAKNRAEAKKAASKARREQRKMLRELSEQEREEMLAREREEKRRSKLERQKAIQQEKQSRRDARRNPKEITVQLSDDEVAEIARLADEAAGISEEAAKLNEDTEPVNAEDNRAAGQKPHEEWNWNPDFEAIFANRAKLLEEADDTESSIEHDAAAIKDLTEKVFGEGEGSEDTDAGMHSADGKTAEPEGIRMWPEFKKPESIPSLRENLIQAAGGTDSASAASEEHRISAINIAEIESGEPKVVFAPVELPEVSLAIEEQEAVDRNELLTELSGEIKREAPGVNYTPVSLEELMSEPIPSRMDEEKDRRRFTTTFSFSWDELEQKLAEVQAEKEGR